MTEIIARRQFAPLYIYLDVVFLLILGWWFCCPLITRTFL